MVSILGRAFSPCGSRLFVIWLSGEYALAPVELFKQDHAHQAVGEGEARKGDGFIRAREHRGGQAVRAADDQHRARPQSGPAAHAVCQPRRVWRGRFHAQGNHMVAGAYALEQRHSRELILYDAAARYLKELKDSGEAITPKAWQREIDQLATGKQVDTLAMKSMREDLKAVERLRKTAEQLSRQERDKSHDREPER